MGKKIWLPKHPRNFGSEKIVRTYVRPVHVSRGEILHFKPPRLFEIKNNNNKADSFFRLNFHICLYIDVDNRERAREREKKSSRKSRKLWQKLQQSEKKLTTMPQNTSLFRSTQGNMSNIYTTFWPKAVQIGNFVQHGGRQFYPIHANCTSFESWKFVEFVQMLSNLGWYAL